MSSCETPTTTASIYLERVHRGNGVLVIFVQLIEQVRVGHFHVCRYVRQHAELQRRYAVRQQRIAVAVAK